MALCAPFAPINIDTGTPVGPHNLIQAIGKQSKLQGFHRGGRHAECSQAFLPTWQNGYSAGRLTFGQNSDAGSTGPESLYRAVTGANTGKIVGHETHFNPIDSHGVSRPRCGPTDDAQALARLFVCLINWWTGCGGQPTLGAKRSLSGIGLTHANKDPPGLNNSAMLMAGQNIVRA